MTDEALIEELARAIASADGLDFDEICGVDADPDNGYCDSGTCVAAFYEDHDADHARGNYLRQARAILHIIQREREAERAACKTFPMHRIRWKLSVWAWWLWIKVTPECRFKDAICRAVADLKEMRDEYL